MKSRASVLRKALLLLTAAILSCESRPDLALSFKMAGLDASVVSGEEISYELVAITPQNRQLTWDQSNRRVLVVAFKSYSDYESYYKGQSATSSGTEHLTWVSVVPQLRDFCRKFARQSSRSDENDLLLRLKQYLGLSYSGENDTIIEMWVSPSDLFRPCVDPEVDDSHCELTFDGENPKVKRIPDYRDFYENLYYSSFRRSPQTPWTGLGYTYDWGSFTNHVGASEFIIVPAGKFEIVSVAPAGEYCGLYDERL